MVNTRHGSKMNYFSHILLNILYSLDAYFSIQIYRFPFNWKNPIGYLFACSMEYIFISNICFAALYSTTFGVGSVFMLVWMNKDVKRDFSSINKAFTVKKNQMEFTKRFTEIIQFYFDTKQFSSNVNYFGSLSRRLRNLSSNYCQ